MKYYFTLTILLCTTLLSIAQSNLWKDIELSSARNVEHTELPTEFRAMSLSIPSMEQLLAKSPQEFQQQKGLLLSLPLPDGTEAIFEVWNSPIMEAGLAENYPNIQTFKAKSISNPLIISRFSISHRGFNAVIRTPKGAVFIEPIISNSQPYYTVAYAKHSANSRFQNNQEARCGTSNNLIDIDDLPSNLNIEKSQSRNSAEAVDLYIYKAAIACSGEYARFHGANTKADALAEIVATLNVANTVFERDLALRLVLIDEVEEIIFLDPATDPYSDGGEVITSYQENPAAIEKIIPVGNFDIGHVLIAGCGSGVVGIGGGKACDASKSLGISCQLSRNNARFAFDIFAHEVGHQFYGGHSWNTCPGNEGQHSSGTAYEPGSGSTIMSYAGACGGGNNIQSSADDYYHITNLEEILSDKLIGRTSSCPEIIATNNTKPIASHNYTNGFFIPIGTPFELIGTGTDEDGDQLTYCWEQYDRGPSTNIGEPLRNTPTFRSYPPTENPRRVFPRLTDVLSNRTDKREVLPTYSRDLTFRMTVRDNNIAAGGVDWTTVAFKATEQAGPFIVEFPNVSNDFLSIGDFVEIKWDVANTNGSQVNCQKVNILLSTDGGATFPIILVENTDNDGTQSVTVPDIPTTRARIRIEAVNNIFFDVSNFNFSIISSDQAGFSFAPAFQEMQVCLPTTVTVDLSTIALQDFSNPITFTSLLGDTIGAIPGFSASFSDNSTTPGMNNQLVLELPADFPYPTLGYDIVGTAEGAETVTRSIQLILVRNQFTGFAIQTPENGLSSVGLPTFIWKPTVDATHYQVEIATSPAFGEFIVDSNEEVVDTFYIPVERLAESTIFYWRVRPVNDCGVGPASEIFAFQTQNLSCTSQDASEVPILISSVGTPTIESKMTVTQNFEISDLNVPNIRGSHDWVSHIRTSLVSPAGTETILFAGKCLNAVPFNLGFDDESPTEIPCPPIGADLHQPQEALSVFDGESTFGDWIMRIEVTDGFGEGGALDDWSLEFCGNVAANPPNLVTNEVLPVKPKSGRLIDEDFLLATDANNSAGELIYTLVKAPTIGTLLFDKNPISIGMQFTQADLNNGKFKYRHDTEATEGTDGFTFTISDGEGGWIGVTPFEIIIDPSATTVGLEDFLNHNLVEFYPNPAKERVQVDFGDLNTKNAQINVYNRNGQLIAMKNVEMPTVVSLTTNDLNSGLYFVQIIMEEGILTKKLVIQD